MPSRHANLGRRLVGHRRLEPFPAVALLGPRQVCQTTLALQLAATTPGFHFDSGLG